MTTKVEMIDRQEKIISIVDDLQEYWPLTVRQCFYQMVAAGHVENSKEGYGEVQRSLKDLREAGVIPWEAIIDLSRKVSAKRGHADGKEYLNYYIRDLGRDYSRCRVQDQLNYLEVWIEKATLEGLAIDITDAYCIRLLTSRGFNSITKLKEYADRARSAIHKGQRPVVLYLGDHDPSGLEMEINAQAKIRTYGADVEFKRVALTYDQAIGWGLPKNHDSVKAGDTRAKRYLAEFGDYAWEAEAIHPAKIQDLIEQSIRNELDAEIFNFQIEKEAEERARLELLDNRIAELLKNEFPEFA